MTSRWWIIPLAMTLVPGACISDAGAQKLEGRVVEHTLDNGMRLILMERHAAPVVSAVIRFEVGSVDEEEGRSGLAHLYEHLAFRGTEVVGTLDFEKETALRAKIDSLESQRTRLLESGETEYSISIVVVDEKLEKAAAELESVLIIEELDQIYNLNGSIGLNATTTADYTTFEVDLPSNRLPLWAVLESDRMAHSIPRDFETERRIVGAEKQARIQDDPDAALYTEFLKAAFTVHPYRRPVPGWPGELESIDLDDAHLFYRTYYSPGNAVAAVVGDIDIEHVIALAETTFGLVPCREVPCARRVPPEPGQDAMRIAKLERDTEPALFMGFHKPRITHPDDRVLEVLSEILTTGTLSRLNQALFVEKQIAMHVASWLGPGDRYPNLLIIAARPIWPHSCEEVEEAVWAELDKLAAGPVGEEELQRAKNRLSANFLRNLQDNRGMAEELSYYELATGDWRNLERRVSGIESIGPEDIQRCAGKYLVRDNCSVARLVSTGRENLE